ncbi:Hypothetical predicted protein [Pelobates cultripes]|uniref:BACK domain-containing protein n=1 Tax=Pelobates cultripes TaxID=61616 RepID=A0AAD1WF47_PELCU|nr:Hypothetical predicted protein [Pelobates cultripes]
MLGKPVGNMCFTWVECFHMGSLPLKANPVFFLQEIIKTQSFRELSDLGLLSILQSNRLTIDEVPLIHAVREWAHVSSVVLDLPVPRIAVDVVKELRLFLLSLEELTTLENENLQDELIPVRYM